MEEDFGMDMFDGLDALELPETGMEDFLSGGNPLERLEDPSPAGGENDTTGGDNTPPNPEPEPTATPEPTKEPTTVEEALKQANGNSESESSEEVASDAQDGGGVETSPNLYSSVAAILHEQGLLPSLDLENNGIESVEDFVKAFNAEKERLVKEEVAAKLGEGGAEAIEAGLSVNEYERYQEEVNTINSITEDQIKGDVEFSKKVIYQDLINQGLSEDRALKTLQRVASLGDEVIIEDALDSIQNIKNFTAEKFEKAKEARRAEIEAEKKAEVDRENKLKKSIYDKEEFIKGIKANKAVKDKVYHNMTHIVGNDPNGRPENQFMRDRREQGSEFDTKLYYFYTITDGFTDFSKLTTKAKSKATNDLEQAFKQHRITNNDTPSFLQDGNSYDSPQYGDIVF